MSCSPMPSTTAIAFMIVTGKMRLEDISKADSYLPPWYDSHRLLQKLLADAWEPLGKAITIDFKALIGDGSKPVDRKKLAKIVNISKAKRSKFVKAVARKADAILAHLQLKAEESFLAQTKRSKSDRILNKGDASDSLRQKLVGQLQRFMEKYPERKLHPRMVELIDQMEASPAQQRALLDNLEERMDSLARDDNYWDAVSSTQASFLWNSGGITAAEEHGFSEYTILNPMDNKTCVVCKRLHGAVFEVSKARSLIDERADIEDPDDLKERFPFPRESTIKHLGMGELQRSDFILPPYHPNCRDIIKFIG